MGGPRVSDRTRRVHDGDGSPVWSGHGSCGTSSFSVGDDPPSVFSYGSW